MKVKIKGFHKFIKKVDPARFAEVKNKALFVGAELLKGKLEEETPVDTGILRQSYKVEKKNNAVIIYNTKKYGLYIHEGTKPHFTSVKNLQGWADRHSIDVKAVQWAIAKKGTKGKKWIPKVLNKSGKKIFEKIEKFISKNLNDV